MISTSNVTLRVGKKALFEDVNIKFTEGNCYGLIGANGAGKSTLMNSIMGLVSKASGSIHYKGEDITTTETAKIVKKGIVLSPEGRHIFPAFTVRDNLMMGGYFSSTRENAETVQTVFQLFPILKDRYNQMGGTLSGGEQQMLAIGRALMARPKIMMLDEPSLGLAPLIISNIFDLFASIRDMGVTIILVEQNARIALKVADRGYVIESGSVVLEDTASNLLKSESVIKAYLS